MRRTEGRGVSKTTVRMKVWRAFETGSGGRLIMKAFVQNGQQNRRHEYGRIMICVIICVGCLKIGQEIQLRMTKFKKLGWLSTLIYLGKMGI